MSSALQNEARQLAALLPPLLIEAERIANTVQTGIHGRRRSGVGETFWQFRDYASGDPAARIDWRQSAHSDRLFIREREWEAAQQVYMWTDNSGSMHYASQKKLPTKTARAHVLMLALTSLLLRGGEKPVWLAREPITVFGKEGLECLAARIDLSPTNENRPPDLPLTHRAHMILCSDFLLSPDQLHDLMQHYAGLNLKGALIHILDPAEEDLPFEGRLEMIGCENEAPLLVPNVGALREAYRVRMAAHKARVAQYAKSAGWFYIPHRTSTSPEATLMDVFQSLVMGRDL
jgi:uncharacterized protein (DUF58 family)